MYNYTNLVVMKEPQQGGEFSGIKIMGDYYFISHFLERKK